MGDSLSHPDDLLPERYLSQPRAFVRVSDIFRLQAVFNLCTRCIGISPNLTTIIY